MSFHYLSLTSADLYVPDPVKYYPQRAPSATFEKHEIYCDVKEVEMQSIFSKMTSHLIFGITDLHRHNTSSIPFRYFFKENSDSFVLLKIILRAILKRIPNYVGKQLRYPRILCVSPNTTIGYPDMWDVDTTKVCSSITSSGEAITQSLHFVASGWTLVCPEMWTDEAMLLFSDCPIIHWPDTNQKTHKHLVEVIIRPLLLVHEQIHFCLSTFSLSSGTKPLEAYTWVDCLNLEEKATIRNPTNYESYLATQY